MSTNLENLERFIQHAPPARELPESLVIGVRGEGFILCHSCMDRILRRGCAIPVPNKILWSDRDPIPHCDLEDYHEDPSTSDS